MRTPTSFSPAIILTFALGALAAIPATAKAQDAATTGVVDVEPEEIVVPRPVIKPRPAVVHLCGLPNVDVYESDHLLGRMPLDLKLTAGRHELRFMNATKGINVYRTYFVRAGENRREELHLGQSRLVVHAPYGASIRLNGRTIGVAPLEGESIYEGEYALEVAYHGMAFTETFRAPAGATIEYRVQFHDADEPLAPASHAVDTSAHHHALASR
jgi:PEGA domain-containing protein